ncbi:MAG: hypothetical protein COY80_04395 [Candidatus Pacebacteria bacterium CG_4_10_14_0_8_um_filter_42_14]|nr:MAG: hypothetical protein COY80_04395 [Candidatus Pacebacteria bacterium CG_4_10_14_0_8_um_filter_42_14]
MNNPKICIVYDRLNTKHGGAEFLLEELSKAFPEASLATSVFEPSAVPWLAKKKVITSFLQHFLFAKKYHQFYLPLMPLAFESLDLADFDIIISVTSAEALGVITSPEQLHISYLLSPPRYLELNQSEYLNSYPLIRLPGIYQLTKLILKYVSWWYEVAAKRPDVVIPLSLSVAKRAGDRYVRLSKPLYPPISIPNPEEMNSAKALPIKCFILSLSRLVWYKRIDLIIRAAKITNKCLIVAGEGSVFYTLVGQAGKDGVVRKSGESLDEFCLRAQGEEKLILFTKSVSEKEKTRLLKYAKVTCMLGREDFGLVALESLAHGTPCLIYRDSGAAEVIENGLHGCVFQDQKIQDVVTGLKVIDRTSFSPTVLQKKSWEYRPSTFRKQVKKLVYDGCL